MSNSPYFWFLSPRITLLECITFPEGSAVTHPMSNCCCCCSPKPVQAGLQHTGEQVKEGPGGGDAGLWRGTRVPRQRAARGQGWGHRQPLLGEGSTASARDSRGLAATKLHRNTHSKAPRAKINLRRSSFRDQALPGGISAAAAAARGDTCCTPFVSSMGWPRGREGVTLTLGVPPSLWPPRGGSSSCWEAPQSCCWGRRNLQVLRSPSHPHPSARDTWEKPS